MIRQERERERKRERQIERKLNIIQNERNNEIEIFHTIRNQKCHLFFTEGHVFLSRITITIVRQIINGILQIKKSEFYALHQVSSNAKR